MSKPNSSSFEHLIVSYLENAERAAEVLTEIISQFNTDGELAQKILLNALRDIVQAQGGFTKLAQTTDLGRESLYKTLSKNGNPRLDTLLKILNALGFEIHIKVGHKPAIKENEKETNEALKKSHTASYSSA